MKRLVRNNNGVALITVVIGVMFCLLLTSTMLRVSLLGLQSRSINNQVTDNYYDAECVLDTIRLNLQNLSARAWKESENAIGDSSEYLKRAYVLLTADDVSHCTVGTHVFTDIEGGTPAEQKYTNIKNKLQDNAKNGGTVESFSSIEVTGSGTKLSAIIIHDVEVKYENPTTKMVSYVKMDITISAPLYASTETPPLSSYSMFVGTGATIGGSDYNDGAGFNKIGYLEQEGNVYIGYTSYNATTQVAKALTVNCRNTLILSGNNTIINGDVTITQRASLQLTGKKVDVRGKIYIDPNCHLIIGDQTVLNCQDILIGENKAGGVVYTSVKDLSNYPSTPKTYPLGEPRKYHAKLKTLGLSDSDKAQAHYLYNPASIVYLEADWETKTINGEPKEVLKEDVNGLYSYSGAGYDAVIKSGVIDKQSDNNNGKSKNLSGTKHINISPGDPNLKPKENVTYGNKQYDQRFSEIIDIPVFAEYFKTGDAANLKLQCEVKPSVQLSNGKYKNTTSASFQSITRNVGSSDKPAYYMKSKTNPVNDSLYKCNVWIGYNNGLSAINKLNEDEGYFIITNLDMKINIDADCDRYSGIFLTSGKLVIQKNDGWGVGESLLNYTVKNNGNLQEFIDLIGRQCCNASSGSYNTIVNNLFMKGIATFYSNTTQAGSSGKVADDQNSTMDLIDFSNYEKK